MKNILVYWHNSIQLITNKQNIILATKYHFIIHKYVLGRLTLCLDVNILVWEGINFVGYIIVENHVTLLKLTSWCHHERENNEKEESKVQLDRWHN